MWWCGLSRWPAPTSETSAPRTAGWSKMHWHRMRRGTSAGQTERSRRWTVHAGQCLMCHGELQQLVGAEALGNSKQPAAIGDSRAAATRSVQEGNRLQQVRRRHVWETSQRSSARPSSPVTRALCRPPAALSDPCLPPTPPPPPSPAPAALEPLQGRTPTAAATGRYFPRARLRPRMACSISIGALC